MKRNDTFGRAASELLERSDVLRHLLQAVADTMIILYDSGEIAHAVSHHPVLSAPPTVRELLERVHDGYRNDVTRAFFRVKARGKPFSAQYQYRSDNGDWIWVESTGIPMAGDHEDLSYIAVLTKDITKQKRTEESLRTMAFHDSLTGLPNRRLFKEHLLHSLAQAKRNRGLLGLLYLDIDDFKRINDTMGHETGDEFLKAFAKRVKGCIREIDMVARMGGDEFTVLLPTVDSAANVDKVAKRILAAISAPWESHGHQFHATVSGGIVVYPENGEDATTLLRHVDMALYSVKGSGRNNFVFYDPAMPEGGSAN
ncbi:sensor domain-containing diguanylate cyclase [Paenibacillus flagellatus]|nr:sensor domain-containing diguanylate cyclase [Paenibacillus flagellatus]